MPLFCTKCGSPIADGMNFCPSCGTPAAVIVSQPVNSAPAPVPLTKPLPRGITVKGGEYQWTGECSAWKCTAVFRIIHIVCAVFAVLICILIAALEGFESVGRVLIYWLIGLGIVGVVDFIVCLIWTAKRAFRYRAVYTIGADRVYSSELETAGKNLFLILIQFIADLASHEDSSGYGMSVPYDKIREIVPNSSRTMIRIKAGAFGKFIITTPEQFDFVIEKLQEKMMFVKRQ